MSTWASIAKSNNSSQKKSIRVSVQYNNNLYQKKQTAEQQLNNDNIPRHREVTPHPADDFIMTNGYNIDNKTENINNQSQTKRRTHSMYAYVKWVDYTKANNLRLFKQSLPISIQKIIEFSQKYILKNV